jgi:lysozyme
LNTGVAQRKPKSEKMERGENNMQISEEGLSLIKKFEGCPVDQDGNCYAYQDVVGVWTIGFGRTKDVKEGDKMTKEEAIYLLQEEMMEYEGYINDLVEVPLEQNQFDALVSWVYNLGSGNLQSSTMLRVLNEGKYEEVPAQIRRWNKAGGEVYEGLVKRRESEAVMFMGGEWYAV